MSLHKLIFDVTDAGTMADSANVGAWVRAGTDGEQIDSTSNALWVHLKASDVTLDIQASHLNDSIKIGDGTDFLAINTDGSINITDNGGSITVDGTVELGATSLAALESITVQNGSGASAVNIQDGGNSITVDAVNLDIRDLAFATDKVDVSGSSVSISGNVTVDQGTSPWVIGDGGGSITVDAVNLDIRDLSAASDNVAAYLKDGSGNSINSTSNALNVYMTNSLSVNDAALANTAIAAEADTVTTTSSALVASVLSNRKYVDIYNNGSKAMYIGQSGVSAANGFPIFPGSLLSLRAGASVAIHAVAASGSHEARVLQLS